MTGIDWDKLWPGREAALVQETARSILRAAQDVWGGGAPETAVVLGSGLGAFGERVEGAIAIPYEKVPHFPDATAPGHTGRLIVGKVGGRRVACMQGRFHAYEGHHPHAIAFPVRVMKELGVRELILTNACGGLEPDWQPGDLMLISDHINGMGRNPLVGANNDEFGPRFPDMTHAYSPALREVARRAAEAEGLVLREGVYVGFIGPSYETPAEIRMFQKLGASAVGMSTVPEWIIAAHCGLPVLGISCVTNYAAGILDKPLTGEEVLATADKAGARFEGLLTRVLRLLAEEGER